MQTKQDLSLDLQAAYKTIERLNTKVSALEQVLSEHESPITDYIDKILADPCPTRNIVDIAKDYKMSLNEFRELLRKMDVLYYKYNVWLVYPQYTERGCTKTTVEECNGEIRTFIDFTKKGQIVLYYMLLNGGYITPIEYKNDTNTVEQPN